MKIETNIVGHRTRDDRRNRQYYRSVSATTLVVLSPEELEAIDTEAFGSGYVHERFFGTHLGGRNTHGVIASALTRSDLPQRLKEMVEGAKNVSSGFRCESWDRGSYLAISVDYQLHAEKPSLIPSEEEALAAFDIDIEALMVEEVEKAIAFVKQRNHELRVLTETENIARWVAEESVEKAKNNVTFDARLQALRDEFDAKVASLKAEVQQEALEQGMATVGDWDNVVEEAIGEGFTEEAVKAAPSYWSRYVEAPHTNTGIFRMPSNDNNTSKIDPEELGFEPREA